MPPLTERAQSELNCANCFKSALHTHLKLCTACKLTPYCSKECQKNHWRAHKGMCSCIKMEKERIEKMSENGKEINGVPALDVDRKFRKWHVAAQPIIDRYLIAAMDFVNHPDRCFTHVVLITVKSNLRPSNLKARTMSDTIKHFYVDYAYMCRIDEMPSGLFMESLRDDIHKALPASKKAREEGTGFGTAFAVVRFPEMGIRQTTNLFLNDDFDPTQEPRILDWVEELKEQIRNGIPL